MHCTISPSICSLHANFLLSAMHVGWLRWAAEATTEPFSLWRLITLNSWTLTPEWTSSHPPSFLQMNQSTIVFMALLAAINAGLFNQRIQSHHNNLHKVINNPQHAVHSQFFYWFFSRGPVMNCGEDSDPTATCTTLWRRATTWWTRQTCERCLTLFDDAVHSAYITWHL